VRSHLLRDGSIESLEALGELEHSLRARINVTRSRDSLDGVRTVRWEGRMRGRGGPLRLRREGDRIFWVQPDDVREELPRKLLDVTIAVFKPNVQIVLRSVDDRTEFVLPSEVGAKLVPIDKSDLDAVTVRVSGEATIDPATAAAGASLPAGDWELLAVVNVLGFTHTTKIRRGKRRSPVVFTSTGGALADDSGTKKEKPPAPPPSVAKRVAGRARWLRRKLSRTAG
jgi:hypothetical protein